MMRPLACLVAMTTACVVAPVDTFPAAQRAVDAGDLLRALAYLDHIPPVHPRYARARVLAARVEARIADCQQSVLLGVQLRAAGREQDAVAAWQRARELFSRKVLGSERVPRHTGTDRLVN